MLFARVVEDRPELQQYREAVLEAEPVVCLLTASAEAIRKRLRIRESGMFQTEAITHSMELTNILENARAEDFTVDND